jgi:hypothetical protein
MARLPKSAPNAQAIPIAAYGFVRDGASGEASASLPRGRGRSRTVPGFIYRLYCPQTPHTYTRLHNPLIIYVSSLNTLHNL